jgi:hypothetical protein
VCARAECTIQAALSVAWQTFYDAAVNRQILTVPSSDADASSDTPSPCGCGDHETALTSSSCARWTDAASSNFGALRSFPTRRNTRTALSPHAVARCPEGDHDTEYTSCLWCPSMTHVHFHTGSPATPVLTPAAPASTPSRLPARYLIQMCVFVCVCVCVGGEGGGGGGKLHAQAGNADARRHRHTQDEAVTNRAGAQTHRRHTRTEPSAEADASSSPSGPHATRHTVDVCPLSVALHTCVPIL